ncbi:EpsG family protein [Peribacillus simplex]|uniref:EpsG family protein n=1 Tax=Peribacillus simplex TaxID=1478 RepID=UPI0010BE2A3E|nr:EpsG family protein [Peribacillus simplex]TKG98976.1 EpsG family protein [Peribacillus simplex]
MVLISAFAAWSILISSSPPNTIINNRHNARIILFCLVILYGFEVANFEFSMTKDDMHVYVSEFHAYHQITLSEAFSISNKEPLFTFYQWTLAQISISPLFFQSSIYVLFISIFLFALRKIFLPWHLLLVFFSYLTFFLFFNYITNVIRQGIAISLLVTGICSLLSQKRNNVTFYISLILAPLFHATSLPFSLVLILQKKFKLNLKFLIFVWVASALLFLTNLNSKILGRLTPYMPSLEEYNSANVMASYNGVNRIDFLLFSAFWIVFAVIVKNYWVKHNDVYEKMINIYTMFNIIFLLLGFVAFSDRIASYSWFLIPLLIWIPAFKLKKYNSFVYPIILLLFLTVGFITGSIRIFLN